METNVPVIEITANHIYLIILGDKTSIDNLATDLNKKNGIKHYVTKIDTPLAEFCDGISNGEDFQILEGAEIGQCYTLAQGKEYHRDLFMLTSLEGKMFGFPKFDLDDECDPEKIIINWFKKNASYIPTGLKRNMEPITVVGANSDILVVACKITYEAKNKTE